MLENKEKADEVAAQLSRYEKWFPKRYVLAIMCHLAFFLRGLVLANISMIIYNHLATKEKEEEAHLPSIANFTIDEMRNIAYSFYWVTAVGQIPSAILVYQFSPHKIMGISIIVSCMLQMITPWTLTKSITGVVAIVFLQAICMCPLDCTCIGLWKRWAPATERNRLLMISFSGKYAHFQISFWFCTYLSEAISLSSIYYFAGLTGAIWCILWCSLLSDSPKLLPEQQCLEEAEGKVNLKSVPVKSILMSLPVLSLCMVFMIPSLSYRLLMMFILIHSVDNIENFAVWTIIVNTIFIIPAMGILMDWLINGKKLKTTTTRKILCSGGLALHVIFFLLYMVPNELVSDLSFIVAFMIMDLIAAGIVPNILDISPRYCVLIMGLAITGVTVSGMLADYIDSLFLSDDSEWKTILIPLAIISLISALLYAIFGSTEEQAWSSATLPTHGNQNEKNTRSCDGEEQVTNEL